MWSYYVRYDGYDEEGRFDGRTVLHKAAENNNTEIYEMLMKRVQNKNPCNKYGVTPLHFAALAGHLEMCKLIINNTEDVNPITFSNDTNRLAIAAVEETPLDLAKCDKVVKLIETAILKQKENRKNKKVA